MSSAPLIHELIESYHRTQYTRASKHYDGAGIEYGIDWQSTLCTLRKLRKAKLTAEYSALETVFAGSCWPEARVHAAFHMSLKFVGFAGQMWLIRCTCLGVL